MSETDDLHPCEAYDLIGLIGEMNIKYIITQYNLNYKFIYLNYRYYNEI